MQKSKEKLQKERRQVYREIVDAYATKFSWLGAQASREMLISAASWNIQKYSDPPFRFRNHVMLAWKRGFLKSTMLRRMADILGEGLTSTVGKVSDAAMRGSVKGGQFTPPKPLRTPIVISTEFGQTSFNDELLNLFLNQLEEGHTNVSLNKIAALSENQRKNIEKEYDGMIDFKSKNEYDLHSDFVFWGATYDPSKLTDDALRSRLNIVTPAKPLDHKITMAADNNPSVKKQLDKTTVRDIRSFLREQREFPTDFRPTENLYEKYDIEPRESRDLQSYMSARNWWGLNTDPKVMEEYIQYLQHSRKVSTMDLEQRIFDLVFDNPMTYQEITNKTGANEKTIYRILERLDADRYSISDDKTKWVVWSGANSDDESDDDEESILG